MDEAVDKAVDKAGEPHGEPSEDAWLDVVERAPQRRGARARLRKSLGGTTELAVRTWDYLTTTVGRLTVMMVLLTALLLSAGVGTYQSGIKREENLAAVLSDTEPMSTAAHDLYMSLSTADTLATGSFVQPGMRTAESHADYIAAIDQATKAADEVQRGSSTSREDEAETTRTIQKQILEIKRQMPFYIAQMERAHANQRMGNPVGVSYMSSASNLMRSVILPKAKEVLDATRSQVLNEMARFSAPQRAPLAGLIAGLIALIACQWFLWRTFRRRFNRGFLSATALMLVAIVWVIAANYSTWDAGSRDFTRAVGPLTALTDARIDAQLTRTDETLLLLRRESLRDRAVAFDDTEAKVNEALNQISRPESQYLVSQARAALGQWHEAHTQLIDALASGDYDKAVATAGSAQDSSPAAPTAADAFTRLDSALRTLMTASRADVQLLIDEGQSASRAVPTGVLVLVILAILSIWLGIRPRIQEYL
ncbi:hypothetical protein GCM10027157_01700 [Corynebacterium aquatimens]